MIHRPHAVFYRTSLGNHTPRSRWAVNLRECDKSVEPTCRHYMSGPTLPPPITSRASSGGLPRPPKCSCTLPQKSSLGKALSRFVHKFTYSTIKYCAVPVDNGCKMSGRHPTCVGSPPPSEPSRLQNPGGCKMLSFQDYCPAPCTCSASPTDRNCESAPTERFGNHQRVEFHKSTT